MVDRMNERLKPAISIIIRTKNEERFIGRTLKAVFAQEIDQPFEVIIIDSGSTDRTLEIVRQFDVRVYEIRPEEFTYGYALNYGARLAKGEYIINLSHDCIPVDARWMANLLVPLTSDPSVAASLGRQVPLKGINPFEERALITHFLPAEEGDARQVFSNANCAIRKIILEKYPFDEKASFAEDFIWAKMLPAEYPIKYSRDASVYHSHPLSLKYWAKRYYNYGFFVPYLEHAYGLKWQNEGYGGAYGVRRCLRDMLSYAAECMDVTRFLLRCRYYRHIPVAPIFIGLRRRCYKKGIENGRKKYEKSATENKK